MLHRGLHEQPLGDRISQRPRHRPAAAHGGFLINIDKIVEHHLGHAGSVDETDQIGLGNAAPDGLEAVAHFVVLPAEAKANGAKFEFVDIVVSFFSRSAADRGRARRCSLVSSAG